MMTMIVIVMVFDGCCGDGGRNDDGTGFISIISAASPRIIITIRVC